ncbi:MAG: pseudouridine synthase [Bacteroidia bacterium]
MENKRKSGKSSTENKTKKINIKSDNQKNKFKKSVEKPKWASKKIDDDFDLDEWDDFDIAGKKKNASEDDYFNKKKSRKEPLNKRFDEYTKSKPQQAAAKNNYENKFKKWQNKSEKNKSKLNNRKVSQKNDDGTIRLNKYIANTGICSRREADELIKAGAVSVNGKIITEMGYKVKPGDVVNYGGQTIRPERKVYILLNKPKDYITTVDDPQKRKTVLELIKGACKERVYPVGRLDRNTTGLLLLTNDGELTKKLTHPSYGVKKIYHVVTDKSVSKQDLMKLMEGFRLDDGFIKADNAAYVETADSKKEIGIELHSGKYRIVRRMLEYLGYKVVKLDRVVFAGLTKKDLPRGHWRFLTEKEIAMLKMLPS